MSDYRTRLVTPARIVALIALLLAPSFTSAQTQSVRDSNTENTIGAGATANSEQVSGKNDAKQTTTPDVGERIVSLQFRDQAWLPAMQWLAEQLGMNLDWQQLPEGEFSLYSTQPYRLSEAEDLMNMQLLVRGFTMLKRGEVLRVVPLKDIDITLVPHVEAEELATLDRHQYARVSFPLRWMIAEEAAEEFKPLLSPYGQLFPMKNSNRLEVMDAIVNLREMYGLLTRAEGDDARRERVVEFQLKHRRAEEVVTKIRELLGLPASSLAGSSQTQLDIEKARFRAEAVKQMGSGARELINEKKPDVFLSVNEKENSILVNAPPNKIEIVRQAIEAIDRPLEAKESTWETLSRVKVHEVEGFDPSAITSLLTSLQERGNLSKDARIQHEPAYNRLIAFASAEDHLTIATLIESFRAKRRSAVVLPLGKIDPLYAVKAVQLILKSPTRPPAEPGVASDGTFQIEADPDHKRLLLWATPDEMKEVQEFLTSLGAGKPGDESEGTSHMHVVSLNGSSIDEVVSQLENIWPDLSDAPLVIEAAPSGKAEPTADAPSPEAGTNPPQKDATTASAVRRERGKILLVSNPIVAKGDDSKRSKPAVSMHTSIPPVRIIEGEQGDVIILSRDATEANSARQLLEHILPEASNLCVIQLKHSQATSIRRQIETLLEKDKSAYVSKLAEPAAPLRIDVDARTNRLLVQNGCKSDLNRIRKYVEALDQAVEEGDRLARQKRVYRFQHRKAEEVATIIKEVYRDLLSINDRVFESYRSSRPAGYNENLAASANSPEYQGLLSVGVDKEANLLVVSAPGYLVDEVIELSKSVDTESDGDSVTVQTFPGVSRDLADREALAKILSKFKGR